MDYDYGCGNENQPLPVSSQKTNLPIEYIVICFQT